MIINNFIPKALQPYIKALHDDRVEFADDIPKKLNDEKEKFKKDYEILIQYYKIQQYYPNRKNNLINEVKGRLYGIQYKYIPKTVLKYADYENNCFRYTDEKNKQSLESYEEIFKSHIQYYKLKRYIIKIPKDPKITLKEHIQMLLGRKCIKFY